MPAKEDIELLRQVELLLAQAEQAGSFLERPAIDDLIVTLAAAGDLSGREFGPFRILHLGMLVGGVIIGDQVDFACPLA
jgi:hypothetical protein